MTRALDKDGLVVLEKMLSKVEIDACKESVRQLREQEGALAGSEYTECNDGAFRLHNLLEKSLAFDRLFQDALVLACVRHVLPHFKLSMLNIRCAFPGQKAQKLHADWDDEPPRDGEFFVVNAMWLLDDFTAVNGATRFVPGSHRLGCPRVELRDRSATHPDEVLVTAQAGSVAVFNSHIWHGGTENRSDAPRTAVNAYYSRPEVPSVIDHRTALSAGTKARFTAEQIQLLAAV
ncbi:phytanoyl-CoA dioxygenase family protein [Kineosporia babensis]|uniref:phytanoyl-CoA dioxygenase family protein n=1 Tax=Kineosporia babensis TaxID=499548 RepID=UPI002F34FD72